MENNERRVSIRKRGIKKKKLKEIQKTTQQIKLGKYQIHGVIYTLFLCKHQKFN